MHKACDRAHQRWTSKSGHFTSKLKFFILSKHCCFCCINQNKRPDVRNGTFETRGFTPRRISSHLVAFKKIIQAMLLIPSQSTTMPMVITTNDWCGMWQQDKTSWRKTDVDKKSLIVRPSLIRDFENIQTKQEGDSAGSTRKLICKPWGMRMRTRAWTPRWTHPDIEGQLRGWIAQLSQSQRDTHTFSRHKTHFWIFKLFSHHFFVLFRI